MVQAGEMVPVPASNLLGEQRGKCLLEAQPLDRLPGLTPGERAAPHLASQMLALYLPRRARQAPRVRRTLPCL